MDCTHPRQIRNPNTGKWMSVPCGMCINCRIAKTREWSLRLMMEKSSWEKSVFLTLTYDDEHLPHTNCGRMTLKPSDPQKFWKRTRMYIQRDLEKKGVPVSPPLLKYFMCGEYGDT